jgi:hypothetical protein
MHLRSTSVILLAAAATLAAANNPFIGKWKENLAQDDYVDATVSYKQTTPGEMQVTAEGQSYKFRMDGKEYPTGFGSVVAWKQVDGSAWETVHKTNGVLDWVTTTRLSANGKTLMVTENGKRSNGEPFEDNETYQRVSGGPGLAGKWKLTQWRFSSAFVMEIAPYEGDGITWRFPGNATLNARFDGKDYTVTGPSTPAGSTVALKRTGPRSFDEVQKINGKIVYTGTVTVSADGNTLTEVLTPPGANEKTKTVYDRQ